MSDAPPTIISEVITKYEGEILSEWIDRQLADTALRRGLIQDEDLKEQSRRFLAKFREGMLRSPHDVQDVAWDDARDLLQEISESRSRLGFSPVETAMFVFSLKQPIFTRLRAQMADDAEGLADEIWRATVLIDHLGLFTTAVQQKSREGVIARQQRDMLELSTPVVELWDGVVAVPLIGTLDSERTQVVMESLLQAIVDTGSTVAIIDITGVPTVDTLVAQHLMKTVAAARLMGTECLISGIRPQIAQTIVHLGVELGEVTTKASLADALRVALDRLDYAVSKVR
jgi:rsbT co-antagonist protein RsbR